jgi:hypothetical protein
MQTHDKHGDLDEKFVHDLATMAGASYRRTRSARENELNTMLHSEYEILDHNKNHTLFRRKDDGHHFLSISGTNINPKEKSVKDTVEDLATDFILARFGIDMTRAGKRFKESDKFTQQVINKVGKENISVIGHSLGGTLSREIGLKHNIQSYSFNPGASPISTFGTIRDGFLDKEVRNRLSKNRTFLVMDKADGIDLLSMSDRVNPYVNMHIFQMKRHKNGKPHRRLKEGVLPAHSIENFKIFD